MSSSVAATPVVAPGQHARTRGVDGHDVAVEELRHERRVLGVEHDAPRDRDAPAAREERRELGALQHRVDDEGRIEGVGLVLHEPERGGAELVEQRRVVARVLWDRVDRAVGHDDVARPYRADGKQRDARVGRGRRVHGDDVLDERPGHDLARRGTAPSARAQATKSLPAVTARPCGSSPTAIVATTCSLARSTTATESETWLLTKSRWLSAGSRHIATGSRPVKTEPRYVSSASGFHAAPALPAPLLAPPAPPAGPTGPPVVDSEPAAAEGRPAAVAPAPSSAGSA
jgi:hypothetical protein